MNKKCKRCGACQECGQVPYTVYPQTPYPWVIPSYPGPYYVGDYPPAGTPWTTWGGSYTITTNASGNSAA